MIGSHGFLIKEVLFDWPCDWNMYTFRSKNL